MRFTLRAIVAVALLVGVYVFGILIVGGLALGVYEAATHGLHGYALAKIFTGSLVAAAGVASGLGAGLRRTRHVPVGVLLPREEQPRLWAEVDELAAEVGTRPPDEIRLIPDVNAAVSEDGRWLGLRPGPRRMYLGMPLLQWLTHEQLRAVLAHELGHYSGRHTALGAVTYRGQVAIGGIRTRLGQRSLVGRLFAGYGRLYLAVAGTVNRRQELEADGHSARIAGRDVAAAALTEVALADAAYGCFMENYALAGHDLGLRPDELFAAFDRFRTDPVRLEELAGLGGQPVDSSRSVYDSHPSTAERLARFQALPEDGRQDVSGPAVGLLDRYDAAVGALETWMFEDSGLVPVAWDRLASDAGAAAARHGGALLIRAAEASGQMRADLGSVLDALGQGRGRGLVRPLFDGEPSPEDARRAVETLSTQLVAAALLDRPGVHHELRWEGPWQLVDEAGAPIDVAELVAHAASSPDAARQVKSLLDAEGVPMSFRPQPSTVGAGRTGPARVHAVAVGSHLRRIRVLFITDLGLAVKKLGWLEGVPWAFRYGTTDPYLATLRHCAGLSVQDLTDDRRTTFTPWPEVTRVVVGKRSRRLTVERGTSTSTFPVAHHAVAGDLVGSLHGFLDDRLVRP